MTARENYQPLVLWTAIVLHLFQGLAVLSSASTNGAVASGTLLLIFGNHINLGLALTAVAVAARCTDPRLYPTPHRPEPVRTCAPGIAAVSPDRSHNR